MRQKGLLARLGLDRRELRAWALYDWANSVFMTTVLQIFPLFFVRVAASGLPPDVARARFAFATSVAVILVGLIGPLLGALADYKGHKKRMLGLFLALGVLCTGAMHLIHEGNWVLAATLFMLANVGATSTLAFYNSLLPSLASDEEIDRVSTAGFALGYLGGGILLALNLLMIQAPQRFGLADGTEATRLSFLIAAVWWTAFSIPLFLNVPEPARRAGAGAGGALAAALRGLRQTFKELRVYRDAGLLLLAFLLYNDAINTIIRMAVAFGDEIGIPADKLILAILMVQFVGVPFAFAFGALADRIGAKRAIFTGLGIYVVITLVGYTLRTTWQFFLLAFLVAMAQGGVQALSRSLFATLIPKHKAGEMFGFYGVFDRFGGALGALVFGVFLSATGSSRPAILALIAFFAVGGALLARVDVERGRALARRAEGVLGDVEPGPLAAPGATPPPVRTA
jgi:UMF1 family MFS transporter